MNFQCGVSGCRDQTQTSRPVGYARNGSTRPSLCCGICGHSTTPTHLPAWCTVSPSCADHALSAAAARRRNWHPGATPQHSVMATELVNTLTSREWPVPQLKIPPDVALQFPRPPTPTESLPAPSVRSGSTAPCSGGATNARRTRC